MVMRVARTKGLIFDENKLDTRFYPTLVKSIFQDEENEETAIPKSVVFLREMIKKYNL